jgi:hypothetical protein
MRRIQAPGDVESAVSQYLSDCRSRGRHSNPRIAAYRAAVGLWCVANISEGAAINKKGPIAKSLLMLVVPAMVYLFFVFYGGQTTAFKRRFARSTLSFLWLDCDDSSDQNRRSESNIFK